MTIRYGLGLVTALALMPAAALAQGTGSEGYFTLFNNTTNNIVVSFYTNDGSGWSQNWLTTDALVPGASATAEFYADTGACDQAFLVGWLGQDGSEVLDEPIAIDICAASHASLDDNETFYD